MQWDGVHALVQRAKAGDDEAWRLLFDLAQPYLLRRFQRTLPPGWPAESVSDLLSKSVARW
jgi:hypothetical protein